MKGRKHLLKKLMALLLIMGVIGGCEKGAEPKATQGVAEQFAHQITQEQLKEIIEAVDFLTIDEVTEFADVASLPQKSILNLYAANGKVEKQTNTEGNFDLYMELSAADYRAFVAQFFGDYPVELKGWGENRAWGYHGGYDEARELICLWGIDGGCQWPSEDIERTTVIDEVTWEDDRLIVQATRHESNGSDVEDFRKITLVLKITEDGYHYVSYLPHYVSAEEKDEVEKAFIRASEAFSWFTTRTLPMTKEKQQAYRGAIYGRVVHPDFQSMADLRGYMASLFSDVLVDMLMGTEEETPRYREFDGVLYGLVGEQSPPLEQKRVTYHVLPGQDAQVIYRLMVDGICQDFVYSKADGQGVFTQFPILVEESLNQPPIYAIVDGFLVGSFENGHWQDTDPRIGDEHCNKFLLEDVLGALGYRSYSREALLGEPKKVQLSTGIGGWGYSGEGEIMDRILAPYLLEDPEKYELAVPQIFGSEFDQIHIPDYGFGFYFDGHVYPEVTDALVSNAPGQVLPEGLQWEVPPNEADKTAITKILTKNGVYYKEPWLQVVSGDFDWDGNAERIIFANEALKEGGGLQMHPDQGRLFSVILFGDEDGTYEVAYSQYYPYTTDVTAYFCMEPLGIFDFNGDGRAEICVHGQEYEGGSTFVLADDAQKGWQKVLSANWGM